MNTRLLTVVSGAVLLFTPSLYSADRKNNDDDMRKAIAFEHQKDVAAARQAKLAASHSSVAASHASVKEPRENASAQDAVAFERRKDAADARQARIEAAQTGRKRGDTVASAPRRRQ